MKIKTSDTVATRNIYRELAMQDKDEMRAARAGVARLYREGVDTMDFMTANPDDRIKFAQESGLFPKP